MKEKNISDIINQFKNEVCYYNQMQLHSMLPIEKNYYLNQIEERTQDVIMKILLMEKQDTNHIFSNDNTDLPIPNTGENDQPITNSDANEQSIPSTSGNEQSIPNSSTNEQPSTNEQQSHNEQPSTNEQLTPNTSVNEIKEFTLDDLAKFNGTDGNPAYVAVNGTVYDVTNIVLWSGGRHNGLLAGKDLSAAFLGCHLGMPERLEKLTKVGKLKK